MQFKKILGVGLRSATVCLLFAICLVAGGALSGLARVAQQAPPAQQSQSSSLSRTQTSAQVSTQTLPQTPPAQGELLVPLLIVSVCVGMVVSYLVLRSCWHGWTLAGAIFVGMYGISTVVNQLDSIFFLSNKLPSGMIRAIFVQGAITAALFAPLAVLVLGKWRDAASRAAHLSPAPLRASSAVWRVAFLVVTFVFLYMLFGYYVAWQNPDLRSYYGGTPWPNFFASLRGNWQTSPAIFLLASFRALLYIAFMYPLLRMLRAARWELALVAALFPASWTTMLLLPNPLMPASVARSHFWETLGFSLVFGTLLGFLMSAPQSAATNRAAAAT